MSLDTVPVTIGPAAVTAYLNKLNERGEVYGFAVYSGSDPLKLELQRDGSDDPLVLHLHSDGTWTATSVLVVGDQLD